MAGWKPPFSLLVRKATSRARSKAARGSSLCRAGGFGDGSETSSRRADPRKISLSVEHVVQ